MPPLETSDPAAVAQQVVELPRNRAPGDTHLEEVRGLVNQDLRATPFATPRVNLSDPDALLPVSVSAVGSAIPPHARRVPRRDSLGCDSKSGDWKWARRQIRECAVDPTWKHVELIYKLGTAFAAALHGIDRCFSPLDFTSAMSSGIFDL